MCGITGIISFNKKIEEDVIYKITEALYHRGPDDKGIYISKDKNVFLGNRRLSIIDLSINARQPMHNEDRSLWITFNGEIYNYKELRNELLKKGHKFISNSDTEVILHLYEEEKEGLLHKLRGMFAFAIWDEREKKLFLARDRMGIKPLYYYKDDNFFIFSSEIKGIINSNIIEKNIDFQGIESYLIFGSIPYPYTIFKNIKFLEPGSYIVLKDKELKKEKYFIIKPEKSIKDYKKLKENLYDILDESVKLHLIADIPIGLFLSGGLDSSTVLYFISKNNYGNFKTFSLSFKEREFDESEDAKFLSKIFETEHYEYEISSYEVRKEIEKFLAFMDSPTIDGLNTYFISKLARENGMKVCLSGLGGDEIFGGYSSFFYIPIALKLKKFNLPFNFLSKLLKPDKKEKFSYFILNPDLRGAFLTTRTIFPVYKLKRILKYKKLNFDPVKYVYFILDEEKINKLSLKNKISVFELRIYMHNQPLRDTDIFSMCHSLEVRVPLLDNVLIDFSFKIPDMYRFKKRILKELMKNYLPEKIIKKPKRPFSFPMDKWIRENLLDFVKGGIFDIESFFDRKEIVKLWEEFENLRVNWSQVWSICILNHYLKINNLV
ncbi:MAG: asparagine synthase (glutamine-hydrolyzing) [candidate division WOR-3 bacterium]